MTMNKNRVVTICMLLFVALVPHTVLGSAVAATGVSDKTESAPDSGSKLAPSDLEPTAIPDDALPNLDSQPEQSIKEEYIPPGKAPSANTPLPPVLRDLGLLPTAVRKTHGQLLEAARNANMDGLRSLIGQGETATTLSIGGLEGDPIEFLKETSGDEDGYELLAILLEVLEAGYVHVDAGTESEMYIWPYFFTWPFEKLTPPMKVELYRILTAGDVQDSTDFGGYIFYRVGIKPDGGWDFFVAGD
jgi:hypothetical protein